MTHLQGSGGIGPLDRGHSPVYIVDYVGRRVLRRHQGWRLVDVFALKGDRVKYILQRPDNLIEHFIITHDVINGGLTDWAIEAAITELETHAN